MGNKINCNDNNNGLWSVTVTDAVATYQPTANKTFEPSLIIIDTTFSTVAEIQFWDATATGTVTSCYRCHVGGSNGADRTLFLTEEHLQGLRFRTRVTIGHFVAKKIYVYMSGEEF